MSSHQDIFGTEPPQPQSSGGGGGPPSGPAGGDLGGTYPNPSVVGLQTRPVANTLPLDGQALVYNGSMMRWEPGQVGLPVITGLTYTTAPTLEGQLYSYTANNTVDLSNSATSAKSLAFAGVWDATQMGLRSIRGVPMAVRFKPGLFGMTGGKLCYLSDTDNGLGTNVATLVLLHYIKVIGYIVDGSMYNSADPTGSLAMCILDPSPLILRI